MVLTQAAAAAGAETPESRAGQDVVRVAQNDAAKTVDFNIPAEPIADALTKLGEQSGLTIIVETKVSKNVQGNALSGQYTPGEALKKLLEPAGLKAEYLDSKTVVVRLASEKGSHDSNTTRAGQNNLSAEGETSGLRETGTEGLEEIVVTGTNIRGRTAIAAPLSTYHRDELKEQGYGTVEEFFRDMPQNTAEISPSVALGRSSNGGANTGGYSAVSLRGLGPQATLTLLNGERRPGVLGGQAFDVSAIPLAVIERVDVVTGGASAVYGADAVAGVVNLVTRREFSGAESEAFLSSGEHGGARVNLNQILGQESDRGGFVLALDYLNQADLDVVSAGRAGRSGDLRAVPGGVDLVPSSERISGFAAFQRSLGIGAELYGDGLFTSQHTDLDVKVERDGLEIHQITAASTRQYSGNLGMHADLSPSWRLQGGASFGRLDASTEGSFAFGEDVTPSASSSDGQIVTLRMLADGTIGRLHAGEIKSAVGVERRWESLNVASSGFSVERLDAARHITSVFGELNVPFSVASIQSSLELAGRYDDYSDVGGTFNPLVGLSFSLPGGVRLRGTFSKAFRAPDFNSRIGGNSVTIEAAPDPSAPDGRRPVLFLSGSNPNLRPEKAESWTLGLDVAPDSIPWLKTSVSLYRIEYRDRIGDPGISTSALFTTEREAAGPLLQTAPSEELLSAAIRGSATVFNFTDTPFDPTTGSVLAAFPDIAYFDTRQNNLGRDVVTGLDFSLDATKSWSLSSIRASLDASYIIDYMRTVTPTTPAITMLNQPGQPADVRVHASLSWSSGIKRITLSSSYVGSYQNPFSISQRTVPDYLTTDLSLSLEFNRSKGALSGAELTLSIQNLFDVDPPFIDDPGVFLNFDPVNADGLGRQFALRLGKRW